MEGSRIEQQSGRTSFQVGDIVKVAGLVEAEVRDVLENWYVVRVTRVLPIAGHEVDVHARLKNMAPGVQLSVTGWVLER